MYVLKRKSYYFDFAGMKIKPCKITNFLVYVTLQDIIKYNELSRMQLEYLDKYEKDYIWCYWKFELKKVEE